MNDSTPMTEREISVNGQSCLVRISPNDRLLDVLREQLGLRGTKEGCARGECGACSVLVAGQPVMSCLVLAARLDGEVETIEGLVDESAKLRMEFADHGGYQCGFCTPGQIVRATALLRRGLPRTEVELRQEISGNICRCTGYAGIVNAIRAAGTGATE